MSKIIVIQDTGINVDNITYISEDVISDTPKCYIYFNDEKSIRLFGTVEEVVKQINHLARMS